MFASKGAVGGAAGLGVGASVPLHGPQATNRCWEPPASCIPRAVLAGWHPRFVSLRLQADTWGPQVGTQNRLPLMAGYRQGILMGHQEVAVGKVRSSTPPGVWLRALRFFPTQK